MNTDLDPVGTAVPGEIPGEIYFYMLYTVEYTFRGFYVQE